MLREIWMCLRGPKLYRIYPEDSKIVCTKGYEPNRMERMGDMTIMSITLMKEITKYGSPLLIPYFYKKDMYNKEGALIVFNFMSAVFFFYGLAWLSRGLGRFFNPSYRDFLSHLKTAQRKWDPRIKSTLTKYDFEFFAWPDEFNAPPCPPYTSQTSSSGIDILRMPLRPLSWLLANTIGLSLVYPGSTALLQAGLHSSLMHGRATLIRQHAGVRYKLRTSDGNVIDTMYIHKKDSKGKTLVINCEGNGGYYEIGVTSPAIEAGYSVLGWNHPGFGYSTGRPFPSQERNAADAVIQFAIHELGYNPSNIVIYGWSIGGFTASWLAMRYPDIKGIVLDATFDVLLPLAISRMPDKISPLIEDAVNAYINLNVAEQLVQYQGIIRLVRRSKDEMIVTDTNDASSNRANNLLEKLLTWRYPHVINQKLLWEYLKLEIGEKDQFVSKLNINESLMVETLASYKGEPFPISLGDEKSPPKLDDDTKNQLTIYLAQEYMLDFDSTHCNALPISYLDHINSQM